MGDVDWAPLGRVCVSAGGSPSGGAIRSGRVSGKGLLVTSLGRPDADIEVARGVSRPGKRIGNRDGEAATI